MSLTDLLAYSIQAVLIWSLEILIKLERGKLIYFLSHGGVGRRVPWRINQQDRVKHLNLNSCVLVCPNQQPDFLTYKWMYNTASMKAVLKGTPKAKWISVIWPYIEGLSVVLCSSVLVKKCTHVYKLTYTIFMCQFESIGLHSSVCSPCI